MHIRQAEDQVSYNLLCHTELPTFSPIAMKSASRYHRSHHLFAKAASCALPSTSVAENYSCWTLERMLPNVYYIKVAQNVAHVLDALKIDYQMELHTEVPNKEFIVQPNHHGISHRIRTPVTVSPQMCRLDDFSVLPKLVFCINETAVECLRKLATADILVMSKSSFSYVSAILNRNGIMLYHPFWHPLHRRG